MFSIVYIEETNKLSFQFLKLVIYRNHISVSTSENSAWIHSLSLWSRKNLPSQNILIASPSVGTEASVKLNVGESALILRWTLTSEDETTYLFFNSFFLFQIILLTAILPYHVLVIWFYSFWKFFIRHGTFKLCLDRRRMLKTAALLQSCSHLHLFWIQIFGFG